MSDTLYDAPGVALAQGLLDHLNIKRAHLMGGCMGCCPVVAFAVAWPEAVASIITLARRREHAAYVCTGNLDHLALLHRDPEFRRVYDGADLVLADGMPVVSRTWI